MKVLVHYKPNKKYENFEGVRMRKTIKGALEIVDIPYTDSPFAYFDVCHLISLDDYAIIEEARERNKIIVVSALYSEYDGKTKFLEYDKNKNYHLSNKAFTLLNKVDLVLVPCQQAASLLKESGITTKIQVCETCVNLSRFNFSKTGEKDIFYRYFKENENKKIVLGLGDSMSGVSAFVEAAKACPKASFYFIYPHYNKKVRFKSILKRVLKIAPKNMTITPILPNDVYRSALINASVFMLTGYTIAGTTSIYEAIASKCQLIVRKNTIFDDFLIDGETAYIGEYSETLTSLCKDYLDGKIQPTINKAYSYIEEQSLDYLGHKLIGYYKEALLNKKI